MEVTPTRFDDDGDLRDAAGQVLQALYAAMRLLGAAIKHEKGRLGICFSEANGAAQVARDCVRKVENEFASARDNLGADAPELLNSQDSAVVSCLKFSWEVLEAYGFPEDDGHGSWGSIFVPAPDPADPRLDGSIERLKSIEMPDRIVVEKIVEQELREARRLRRLQRRPVANAVYNNQTGKTEERESSSKQEPSEPRYVFAPDGDGYYIEGFGESGHVKRLKGFDFIARLIQSPRIPVAMVELIGTADDQRITNDRRTRQPIIGPEGLTETRKKLGELCADRDKYRENNDSVNLYVTEEQINDLEEQLSSAVGKFGLVRNLNSRTDKMRPTIHGALNRAYEKLRGAHPSMMELANHFGAAIGSEGATFVYNPVIDVEWTNSRKSNL